MMKIISISLFLIIISIAYSINITEEGILFEYEDDNAQSVYLVGSMNGWDTTATPMSKDEDGVWRILLKLDYGDYTYKYMVDGNWQFDQENSQFEDDGYGGSNSVIKYNGQDNTDDKNFSKSNGVQSGFNPKIFFKGQYFSNNIFLNNETSRFMLDKPEHDFNFGIKVKFNSDFEGYTILHVNNNNEGTEMWKTHFNYKRSYLKFNAEYIDVIAFDNMGLFSFDNPLHMLGDEGYNKYKFGFNYSGLHIQTSRLFSNKISQILPVAISSQILLSDRIGYSEDDISAMRVKLSSPIVLNDKLTFGISKYKYTTKLSDEFVQNHNNYGYDVKFQHDISKTTWKDVMRVTVSAEYSEYENLNNGNENEMWMEGHNIFVGTTLKFPAALQIHANYINSLFSLGTESSIDKINIGAVYQVDKFLFKINMKYWENHIADSLGWVDYYKYFEKTGGNGRWFQEYSEVPFQEYTLLGYKTGLSWESKLSYSFLLINKPFKMMLLNKSMHYDLFTSPKFIESIVIFEYSLSDKWMLKTDTRIPYYNDSFLNLKTDFTENEDTFIANYFEVSYHLSKNAWIAIGYGLNPFSMDAVTDQFHYRARDEYLNSVGELPSHLESYYGGIGEKMRQAETSLMNEKRISIQAIIKF